VCVECLESADCSGDRVCDPGSSTDNLPFCRVAP
jgi:Cys-rich repeat protein